MKKRVSQLLSLVVVSGGIALGAWSYLHVTALRRPTNQIALPADFIGGDAAMWSRSVEKVKEDRLGAGGDVALQIPEELRHYSDRHWFLATQVAEVEKFNVRTCQDFVELASMIQSGELVSVPFVTSNYILFGVGSQANDRVFSRYENDHEIAIYDDAELRDAYARIETERSRLKTDISQLSNQLSRLKKSERAREVELQKQISARREELKARDDDKTQLDEAYGQPDSRRNLFSEYESLKALAKNFGGRSYDLNAASDRMALKINMLSSLRPQALKILEEVANDYHASFGRPLPVSSLVRPEQYQRALSRVNRNAVLIETPPHSTGLAFDIDYRYMSVAEQNFVMAKLARMEDEGRIEVIRERNANYHVFAFVEGKRPGDDLITASLEDATMPVREANHAVNNSRKVQSKSRTVKKSKVGKPRSAKSRVRRRR